MTMHRHGKRRSSLFILVGVSIVAVAFLLLRLWHHREVSTPKSSCPSSLSSLDNNHLPKFEAFDRISVCSTLPNASPSYVWNHYSHGGVLKQPGLSSQDLRRGIVTRPRLQHWGQLLEKVSRTLQEKTSNEHSLLPPVQLLVLTGNSNLVLKDAWPFILEQWVNRHLGGENTSMILKVEVLVLDSALASSLYISGLLPSTADIIIDAYASQEMALEPQTDRVVTPSFANAMLQRRQDFLRSVLLENCHLPTAKPLLILLDDHFGTTGLLTDSLSTRVLQRLTDWYQVPFVSFGKVVRPLLYDNESPGASIQISTGIASSLAFAALDFTIEYCSSLPQQRHEEMEHALILKEGVQQLVESVLPPPLDLDLSLQQVSAKWRKTAAEEHRQVQCHNTATICPLVYAANYKPASTGRQRHGWISDVPLLAATKSPRWTTTFVLPQGQPRLELFVKPNAGTELHIRLVEGEASPVGDNNLLSNLVSTTPSESVQSRTFDLSSWKGGNVTLTLQLVKGDSIRIAGLVVCSGREKAG